jgi:hypothetical protein
LQGFVSIGRDVGIEEQNKYGPCVTLWATHWWQFIIIFLIFALPLMDNGMLRDLALQRPPLYNFRSVELYRSGRSIDGAGVLPNIPKFLFSVHNEYDY